MLTSPLRAPSACGRPDAAAACAAPETLLSRAAVAVGAVSASVAGCFVALFAATSGWGSFFQSDAWWFRHVATHLPFGTEHSGEAAYRTGRILYPFLGWVLAFGQSAWTQWSLPLLNVLAIGLIAAVAAEFARREGMSPKLGYAVFLVPGLWATFGYALSDALAVAFVLLALLAVRQERLVVAWAAFALAGLTREAVLLALLPVLWCEARDGRWKRALGLLSSVIPILAWHAVLRVKFGFWPMLAPRGDGRMWDLPARGWVLAPSDDGNRFLAQTTLIVLVTLFIGVVVWRWGRSYPMGWVGVFLAATTLLLTEHAWRFRWELLRVLLLTHVCAVIALTPAVVRAWQRRTERVNSELTTLALEPVRNVPPGS